MTNSDSKIFAFIGVLLTVIGFIIVFVARKKDKYAMYYARQGLVLFFLAVLIGIATWATAWIPLVGPIINWALKLFWIVLWIIGLIFSVSNKYQNIPLIGDTAEQFE
jgi:uncharacterized membrane protein